MGGRETKKTDPEPTDAIWLSPNTLCIGPIIKSRFLLTLAKKRELAKDSESLRLVYYDLVVRILREQSQVIPCYAGISNVHINYDGEVWPCCVLGYSQPMGSLREQDYNFQSVWRSSQAKRVRKHIKDKNCVCPLANQAYSNILCSPRYLLKTIQNIQRLF